MPLPRTSDTQETGTHSPVIISFLIAPFHLPLQDENSAQNDSSFGVSSTPSNPDEKFGFSSVEVGGRGEHALVGSEQDSDVRMPAFRTFSRDKNRPGSEIFTSSERYADGDECEVAATSFLEPQTKRRASESDGLCTPPPLINHTTRELKYTDGTRGFRNTVVTRELENEPVTRELECGITVNDFFPPLLPLIPPMPPLIPPMPPLIPQIPPLIPTRELTCTSLAVSQVPASANVVASESKSKSKNIKRVGAGWFYEEVTETDRQTLKFHQKEDLACRCVSSASLRNRVRKTGSPFSHPPIFSEILSPTEQDEFLEMVVKELDKVEISERIAKYSTKSSLLLFVCGEWSHFKNECARGTPLHLNGATASGPQKPEIGYLAKSGSQNKMHAKCGQIFHLRVPKTLISRGSWPAQFNTFPRMARQYFKPAWRLSSYSAPSLEEVIALECKHELLILVLASENMLQAKEKSPTLLAAGEEARKHYLNQVRKNVITRSIEHEVLFESLEKNRIAGRGISPADMSVKLVRIVQTLSFKTFGRLIANSKAEDVSKIGKLVLQMSDLLFSRFMHMASPYRHTKDKVVTYVGLAEELIKSHESAGEGIHGSIRLIRSTAAFEVFRDLYDSALFYTPYVYVKCVGEVSRAFDKREKDLDSVFEKAFDSCVDETKLRSLKGLSPRPDTRVDAGMSKKLKFVAREEGLDPNVVKLASDLFTISSSEHAQNSINLFLPLEE